MTAALGAAQPHGVSKIHTETFAGLLWLALLLGLCLSGPHAWASGAIVTTTVEGALPAYTDAVAQYSQVCHDGDSTYAVSLDPSGRPQVTRISPAGTTVGFVDAPDIRFSKDGHLAFSLGIDKAGFLHITGGMHQGIPSLKDPNSPDPNSSYYPARFFDSHQGYTQNILYWKSKQPRSVTAGFTFCGLPVAAIPATGWRTSTTIPGGGWQDGRFITDAGGELYYYSMVDSFARAAWGMGDRSVGFYHYDTTTRTWTAYGGEADHTAPGSIAPYYTVLFWQYRDDGWQNFQGTFQFDSKNRLHFATACDTDPSRHGNPRQTRLFYAYSDNGGKTWRKAGGAAVPGLPLRGDDGEPDQISIVRTDPTGAIVPWTSVVVDAKQRPLIGNAHLWDVWDGHAWARSSALSLSGADRGTHGRSGDSNMYFLHIDGAGILWTPDPDQTPVAYECPGYQQYLCLDEHGLRRSGVFYGVGLKRSGSATTAADVLKTTIIPAPLPAGWTDADIWDLPTRRGIPAPFHGFSGFGNSRFIVNDYGYVINNTADDFHFVYRKLTGDGQIVARVAGQVPGGNALAMAGVMMRETLAPGSPNIALCLSGAKTAWFNTRSLADQGVSSRYSFPCDSSWVKLVRAGSAFTAYTSTDGVTWAKVSAMTISMAPTICVGLSCAGYQNGGGMHTSTFDHVILTPPGPASMSAGTN